MEGLAVAIFIAEILFNPAGVDTGFEYVVIENRGGEAKNLQGIDLYFDSSGYFTFPQFSLGAGKRVTIFVRASGTDTDEKLYFSSASANMGNTSGSVALFSSTDHSEATLVDFVQYGKAGETWESAAEKKGVWVKGDFVSLSNFEEGQVLHRKDAGHGVSSWEVATAAVLPPPLPPPSGAGEEEDSSPNTGGKVYSGPTFNPEIKAYAGHDQKSVAGAEVSFAGRALGWGDEVLLGDHIRFLWNFGDGASYEGKNAKHIYHYPGTYIAALHVISGEESAHDTAQIAVSENPVFLSEFVAGAEGWIELGNDSGDTVSLSGWILENETGGRFVFREGTFVAPRSYAVFSKEETKLIFSAQNPKVFLFYPNGKAAGSLIFSGSPGILAVTQSGLQSPTPGIARVAAIKTLASVPVTETKKKQESVAVAALKNEPKSESAQAETKRTAMEDESGVLGKSQTLASVYSSNVLWLVGSITAGLAVGFLVLVLRKRSIPES